MKNKTQEQNKVKHPLVSNHRVYEKPVLQSYGDVRDITLGPTVGEGESGCAIFFRSGPGGCPSP